MKKKIKTIGDYPLNAKPDIRTFDRVDWVAIAIAIFAVILFVTLIGSI